MREGWNKKALVELCDFGNGLWTGKKPPFVKVGVIRNTNFTKEGKLNDSNIAYLDVEQSQFLKRKLQCGDIILEKSGGGPKQPVGRVVIFDNDKGDFSFSNFTSSIRVKDKNEIDFNYLHRFLFFEYISGATEQMQSHSTGIRNLNFDEYKQIEITYPSLPEQKRIVEILDEAFAAIDKAKANVEKNLQNAKELFENLTQLIFTNKGDDWLDKPLGEIANFKNGLNFTKSSKGQAIKIVGVKDFQKSFWVPIDALELATIDGNLDETYLLQKDDIVTVRSNGNPELIGRTLLAGNVVGDVSHSGFTIRIRLHNREIFPEYLCHYLKSKKARKELVESGNGVNIKSLNQGGLSSLVISFPKSYKEQECIVEKLEGFSVNSKKLEAIYSRKLNDLEELKKSILQKAFTGELTFINSVAPTITHFAKVIGISATDLHASIIAFALKKHHGEQTAATFGNVKAEKITNTAQYLLEIDLERNPYKDAAGPNDYKRLLTVQSRAAKAGIFSVSKRGEGYSYHLNRQAEVWIEKAKTCLGQQWNELERLIDLFIPLNTDRAEVVATVYAAWNNLLIDGKTITDEAIVYEARENWHSDKLKIPREHFFKSIDWLRRNNLIPKGVGKKVTAKHE